MPREFNPGVFACCASCVEGGKKVIQKGQKGTILGEKMCQIGEKICQIGDFSKVTSLDFFEPFYKKKVKKIIKMAKWCQIVPKSIV